MTWKRFLEILLRGPKAIRLPKLVFSNLGCGRTLGEDIKEHHDVGFFYDYKTDKWTRHVYCPNCGTHGEYTHNLVKPMFAKDGICFKCSHLIPNYSKGLPTITVCLRKSAFPDGEVFYFWEFKHESEKKNVLGIQNRWRAAQELEFSIAQ